MKVPITATMLAVSILILIYFSGSIFNEVDNRINVTGTDYEDQYNATHNVTQVSLSVMNYIALLVFLLLIVSVMVGFYTYM